MGGHTLMVLLEDVLTVSSLFFSLGLEHSVERLLGGWTFTSAEGRLIVFTAPMNTLPTSCFGSCDAFFCCDGLAALDTRLLGGYLRRLVPVMKPGAIGLLAGHIKGDWV